MAEDKKTVLNVLFPEQEVDLGHGVVVKVTPLPLKDLPKVAEAFGVLMGMAERGLGPAQLASMAFGEVAKLIPYCIDYDWAQIPAASAPPLLEVIVEQNITDEVIKNWTALVEKVSKMQEIKGLVAPDQGSMTPPLKSS
jgi:hypothetical protein